MGDLASLGLNFSIIKVAIINMSITLQGYEILNKVYVQKAFRGVPDEQ